MIKILIAGKDSYVGTSFEKWMGRWPEKYIVDTLDTKGDWKKQSFEGYDVVFSVVGIAHVHAKKKMESLYYKINRDLTIDLAQKAKKEKVKQFIFMSSMSVYGINSGIINKNTIPSPKTYYGKSKLEAEQKLQQYNECKFNVAVIRPPMIYGKGSKGNYPKLAKLARRSPIFPDIENERSMLYIENLCAFIQLMIDHNEKGIFFPQNKEYVNTTKLVQTIAQVHGKKISLTKLFNPLIKIFSKKITFINKIFGNLVCERDLSNYDDFNYCVSGFNESIKETEKSIE